MCVTKERTVRKLALKVPGAARVFERFGIDYCCGGTQTLVRACQSAHLNTEYILEVLARAKACQENVPQDDHWQTLPLGDLIAPIKASHHKYTREEITRLRHLFDKVYSVHAERHFELLKLRATFQG